MKLKRWKIVVAGVALIPLLLGGVYVSVYQYGRYIPVNRETTYITGPMTADGRLDYAAAIMACKAQGVTPQNNAAVLLMQATGDYGPDVSIDWALTTLGAADQKRNIQPIETTDPILLRYYDDSTTTHEQREAKSKELVELDHRLSTKPWRAEHFPEYAELMRRNAPAFDLIEEAVRRDHFYWPVSKGSVIERTLSTPFGGLRNATGLLQMRSMMHAGVDNRAAMRDLITIVRLGNVVAAEPTAVAFLTGAGIHVTGFEHAARLAPSLTAAEISELVSALDAIGQLPTLARAIDETERLVLLSQQYDLVKKNGDPAEALKASKRYPGPSQPKELSATIVRWLPIQHAKGMRLTNQWMDILTRASSAIGFKDYQPLQLQLASFWVYVPHTYTAVAGGTAIARPDFYAFDRLILVRHIIEDRRRQAILWLRLLAHFKQHGQFPESLAAANLHTTLDPFTDQPYLYEKTADGFELRSVGPDMADDRSLPPAVITNDGRDRVMRYPLASDN